MPSSFYDVWNDEGTDVDLANWKAAYDYLSSSKANRQLNWDGMYHANKSANLQGVDAMYYQQAYHDDQLAFSLSSTLTTRLSKNSQLNLGFNLSTNKGMHYQTMEDLLGANSFHNINTDYCCNSTVLDNRFRTLSLVIRRIHAVPPHIMPAAGNFIICLC